MYVVSLAWVVAVRRHPSTSATAANRRKGGGILQIVVQRCNFAISVVIREFVVRFGMLGDYSRAAEHGRRRYDRHILVQAAGRSSRGRAFSTVNDDADGRCEC
jgi:hypothetical protein